MASESTAAIVPPVEAVVSELVMSLAFAAHSYLEPQEAERAPDLDAAEISIDLAGVAFDRISPRLSPDQRTSFAALMTDLRMRYVRKRG